MELAKRKMVSCSLSSPRAWWGVSSEPCQGDLAEVLCLAGAWAAGAAVGPDAESGSGRAARFAGVCAANARERSIPEPAGRGLFAGPTVERLPSALARFAAISRSAAVSLMSSCMIWSLSRVAARGGEFLLAPSPAAALEAQGDEAPCPDDELSTSIAWMTGAPGSSPCGVELRHGLCYEALDLEGARGAVGAHGPMSGPTGNAAPTAAVQVHCPF
eukprot:919446-Heterocapsa_arctica.AAC.4